MKLKNIPYFGGVWFVSLLVTICCLSRGPRLLLFLGVSIHIAAMVLGLPHELINRIDNPPFSIPSTRRYRPRNTGAGRWLEAPVAELDKSTIGKLLASRASRDPSLHVVVRSTPDPVCSDALYDAELDG
jgi:hypothetical protein